MELVGRERECRRLDRCMEEEQAQLAVVYGRRRVGKTFLIQQYFHGRFDFCIAGIYRQPKEIQLKNFWLELNRQAETAESKMPKDWMEAFAYLRAYIETLSEEKKQIVFLDEMPWLDTPKSGFLSAFEWFWNDFGSSRKNLVCIVCGSATSWLVDKIENNKGGLFNRQTCRLYLEPFTLAETEAYLNMRGIRWSRLQIAECYMIMGGIPYYLSLLDRALSLQDNIDELFFRKRAELWDEFDQLYHTLFKNSEKYIHIAEALSKKRMGLTRAEIAEKAKLPANGELSKIIGQMVDTGFVRATVFYGRKKRETLYQLSDYYSCFYFRYIKENYGKDEHYWAHTLDHPSRRAWAGLTFEQLCRDHIGEIKAALGISGILTEESAWYFKGTQENEGAQVDLLIDRRDQMINLCEIKFSINEYEIDRAYEKALRQKIDSFVRNTGCRKGIALTVISTFGIKKNQYSALVNSEVVLDDLFNEREKRK